MTRAAYGKKPSIRANLGNDINQDAASEEILETKFPSIINILNRPENFLNANGESLEKQTVIQI